jgi:hypothetical protein
VCVSWLPTNCSLSPQKRKCHWVGNGGDFDELGGDHVVKPIADSTIHLAPMRISSAVRVNVHEDMVRELVLTEGVEEESLPPVVVR